MPVFADNLFDMERFSVSMNWNAEELRLKDLTTIHPLLARGIISVDSTKASKGILTFKWADTINFKLVPGTKLFDLCFEVLANPGTKAEISFDENGTLFDNGNFQSEWEGKAGTITVEPETWNVVRYYTYCYTGQDSVDITFHTLGNAPPYTMEIPEAGISQSGIQGNEISFTDFFAGEFSYRITDDNGGTHFVRDAIDIPSGSQTKLSLAEAIPPKCGGDKGLIKLNTIETDYQFIHVSGPGVDEAYPPKTLFEDLTSDTYTDRIFINITVEDVPEEEISFFIPNSFTPNEDGTNDRMELFSPDPNLIIEEVRIFDAYGNNLHTRTGPVNKANLWDGRVEQKKVLPGVYVLKIHIRRKGESIKQIIRDVTVIR